MSTLIMAQNGKASTLRKTFSRETSVKIDINATPSIIWALLSTAADYPRWNSTIISIDGHLAPGEKIWLTSTLDPNRIFKLTVKAFEPETKLVWGDGMGNRVYLLTKISSDTICFSMTEKIGGPLFPLFGRMIPSFDASFEQFAADLKKEAEKIMRTN